MSRFVLYDVVLQKEKTITCKELSSKITSSFSAGKIVQDVLNVHNWTVEKFGVLCLNNKNVIIGLHIVSSGTEKQTLGNPKGIFQRALLNNASSIIVFHNHPGGSSMPSKDDVKLTLCIKEIGKMMEIPLIDHIIIYDYNRYFSFAENNLLEKE